MWKSVKKCLHKWIKCETTSKFNFVSTWQRCWHYEYRTHSHSGSGCCWADNMDRLQFPLLVKYKLFGKMYVPRLLFSHFCHERVLSQIISRKISVLNITKRWEVTFLIWIKIHFVTMVSAGSKTIQILGAQGDVSKTKTDAIIICNVHQMLSYLRYHQFVMLTFDNIHCVELVAFGSCMSSCRVWIDIDIPFCQVVMLTACTCTGVHVL